jgi:hypothetical protein
MAAKKTAAKKAAAPVKQHDDVLGAFPLHSGHYFHPPVVSPAAHDGSDPVSYDALRRVQRVLDLPETGAYDDATRDTVVGWKTRHHLGSSPVIDEETWQALRTIG